MLSVSSAVKKASYVTPKRLKFELDFQSIGIAVVIGFCAASANNSNGGSE